MTTISDIRALHSMEGVTDAELEPHLASAERDFRNVAFGDEADRVEAIASKAIYYASELFWARTQKSLAGYETSYQSSKDIEVFRSFWLKRSEDAAARGEKTTAEPRFKWGST